MHTVHYKYNMYDSNVDVSRRNHKGYKGSLFVDVYDRNQWTTTDERRRSHHYCHNNITSIPVIQTNIRDGIMKLLIFTIIINFFKVILWDAWDSALTSVDNRHLWSKEFFSSILDYYLKTYLMQSNFIAN